MSGGLEPENLTENENKLLRKEFGKNWLVKLGYQSNIEYLEHKYKNNLSRGERLQ